MSDNWSTCALCPRLCRVACPVATGSGREAAVPTLMATVIREYEQGRVDRVRAVEAATLCTDCGACQDICHIDRPLPAFLRDFRSENIQPPAVAPLLPIEGDGDLVAIEADDRPLAATLAAQLDQPVARWGTSDRLGVAAIEHPSWQAHARELRQHVGQRRLVVVDGGVAQALTAAGLGFQWLHQVVRGLLDGAGSCQTGGTRPLACCGAAGPLLEHHPADARRVGRLWLERADDWRVSDGRCRAHLRACGGEVTDPLDVLMELVGAR